MTNHILNRVEYCGAKFSLFAEGDLLSGEVSYTALLSQQGGKSYAASGQTPADAVRQIDASIAAELGVKTA